MSASSNFVANNPAISIFCAGVIAKQTINSERAAESGDGTQPFQDKNVLFPIPDVEKNYNPNVAKDVKNGWN